MKWYATMTTISSWYEISLQVQKMSRCDYADVKIWEPLSTPLIKSAFVCFDFEMSTAWADDIFLFFRFFILLKSPYLE